MTSLVKESWDEFIKTLSSEDKEIKIKCPILELFDEQEYFDRIRRDFSKTEINQILKQYLSLIDLVTLRDKIRTHRNNFERGFGKDRLNHLKLLVSLLMIDEERKPKRGLLAS